MLAPGYIKVPAGRHPDHGEPVDYMAGSLLPEWLSDLLENGKATLAPLTGHPGYFELVMSRPRPAGAGRRHGSVKR